MANGGVDTAPRRLPSQWTWRRTFRRSTAGANQTIVEDAGPQTVAGWATGISPGPANESSQTFAFAVTTDNDAMFSVLPSVAADGTLRYTAAPNAFGTATITVTLADNGGTANGGVDTSGPQTFNIAVSSVNDAPVLVGDAELTPILRNSTNPAGTLVGDFAGPVITEPDADPLEGIAIVGSTGTAAQGVWQFSTNGGQDWSPLGTSTAASARLLRDTDLVRFVPAAGFVGTVTLTYRGWDQTTGTAGQTADLTGGVGGGEASARRPRPRPSRSASASPRSPRTPSRRRGTRLVPF